MENKWIYDKKDLDPAEKTVKDSLRKRRMEICKKCEFMDEFLCCELCGCFLPVKTFFRKFHCPTNKWPHK